MIRGILTIFGIGALVAAVVGVNLSREPGRIDLDWRLIHEPAPKILAEPLSHGTIVQTITASGKIESVEEAEIASQIIGRVTEVGYKEGDAVKKGNVLVQIDKTDAQARLDSVRARISRLTSAIDQAESDLQKAKRDAGLSSKLAGRGFSTPTELADSYTALAKAEAALAMSRNELSESEAMRRSSEEEVQRTSIRAPIDGVVSDLNVDVGEIVIAGTTNLPGSVLMKVCDMTRMRVRADVDETDVLLVRPGQPARIFPQADQLHPIAGSIDRVAPQGKVKKDEVVSFETLVNLAPSSHGDGDPPVASLRPGMSVTVEVEVRRADDAVSACPPRPWCIAAARTCPTRPCFAPWAERSVRSPGEKARDAEVRYLKVMFVVEGDVARARPIDVGLSDERRVEVRSGVEPDERVIVGPFHALDVLKDGDPVVPVATAAELDQPN